jgi:hypothetical protein
MRSANVLGNRHADCCAERQAACRVEPRTGTQPERAATVVGFHFAVDLLATFPLPGQFDKGVNGTVGMKGGLVSRLDAW